VMEDSPTLSSEEIERCLDRVPNHSVFLTADEIDTEARKIAEDHPEVVRILTPGTTTDGLPLLALEIGDQERTALLVGAPHPNEPVGTLTTLFLARQWAENRRLREESGFRLVVVPAIDRDGLLLNEGWFKGPFTPMNYALHYYRPPGNRQPEWTFPIDCEGYAFRSPIPETQAWMRLIDQYRPSFLYSLHNGDVGELFYYVSRPLDPLCSSLQEYPRSLGIPLKNTQQPEEPWSGPRFSDGVYEAICTAKGVRFLREHGMDPPTVISYGAASWEYAQTANPGCFSLVSEVPLFTDPRGQDPTETAKTMEDLRVFERERWEDHWSFVLSVIDEVKTTGPIRPGRFEACVASFQKFVAGRNKVEGLYDRRKGMTTVGETFQTEVCGGYYLLRTLGLLYRYIQEQGRPPAVEERLLSCVMDRMRERNAPLEQALAGRNLPLSTAVRLQVSAGLSTMRALGR